VKVRISMMSTRKIQTCRSNWACALNVVSFTLGSFLLMTLVASCTTSGGGEESSAKKSELHGLSLSQESQLAKEEFLRVDPGLKEFFDESAGYAIFPSVAKGAVGVGGAYGEGCVYYKGELIGYSELSQVTFGLQLGGQAFREVVFFKYSSALEDFKKEKIKFSANASAVAVTAGSSGAVDYQGGVAVFTMAKGGLMFEASIGGQKFSYDTK